MLLLLVISLRLGVLSIAISVSVDCLSVSLSTRISKITSKFHQIFCTCYLQPWLGPFVTTMLSTSGFVDDVTFSHDGANGPESTTRFAQFARWWHGVEVCRLRLHLVHSFKSRSVF